MSEAFKAKVRITLYHATICHVYSISVFALIGSIIITSYIIPPSLDSLPTITIGLQINPLLAAHSHQPIEQLVPLRQRGKPPRLLTRILNFQRPQQLPILAELGRLLTDLI